MSTKKRSIHLASGFTLKGVQNYLIQAQNQGYIPIIATLDGEASVSHIQINLSWRPDNVDDEIAMIFSWLYGYYVIEVLD